MVLPGLWFGAVLGMHLTNILGALECSLPPANVPPTCEPEPEPELQPVPEPEPQPVPDPELKLVVESAPKCSCTAPIFWPPGPPVETLGERKAWNIVFLLLLVASFLPAVLAGLSGSVEWEEMRDAWYMPLVGICGCTLASSTPVGGAIFFIPGNSSSDLSNCFFCFCRHQLIQSVCICSPHRDRHTGTTSGRIWCCYSDGWDGALCHSANEQTQAT